MKKLQTSLLWCYYLLQYTIVMCPIYCKNIKKIPPDNIYAKLFDNEKINIKQYNDVIDRLDFIQSENYISYNSPTQSTIRTSSYVTSNLSPSDNTTTKRTTPTPPTRPTTTTITSFPPTIPPTESTTETLTTSEKTTLTTTTSTTTRATTTTSQKTTLTTTTIQTTPTLPTILPTDPPTTIDPNLPQYPTHYHGSWMVSGIIFIVLTVAGFFIMLTLSATMPAPILPPAQKFFIPRPVTFSRIV